MDKKLFFLFAFVFAIFLVNNVMALTPDGSTPAPPGDFTLALIIVLFIFATLGLFYTFFLGLAKLAVGETTVYDVLVSWAFYILTIIVNHLTAHYVEDVFMYDLTNTFLSLTVWTNGVLPVIAFVISIFIRSTKKKKLLSVGEIAGRQLS